VATVTFDGVSKVYDNGFRAVDALDLQIRDGEFMVLVGPSGCGKTTALRMLAGLEEISDGDLVIDDLVVNEVAPQKRDIAMVFQNYALYPHLSVYDNMAYGLKIQKLSKADIRSRVNEIAKVIGLEDLLDRKPKALSGGQRQRVAMGRAIVRRPKVFLMDEPLSNLDAKLRVQMRADIATLQSDFGVTTVYVTHDQAEAMTLGHRVAVLQDGRLQQCGPPRFLYERPANVFVAGFIGSPAMNLCPITLTNGTASFGGVEVPLPDGASANGQTSLVLGVRPESLEVAAEGVPARVDVIEDVGADAFVFCTTELGGETTRLVARTEVRKAPKQGDRVALRPRADEAHLFDPGTGLRLGAE
jgi:multiple sugar transport system ATP-binding protein